MPVTEPESIMVGAMGGAMVPLVLRRYKDRATPTARLSDEFKRPSVFGAIGLGAISAFFGLMGARGKGPLGANEPASHTAVAFGGASMMGGLGSWMFPQEEMATAAGLAIGRPARGVALGAGKPGVAMKVAGRPAVIPKVGVPAVALAKPKPETPSGAAIGGF